MSGPAHAPDAANERDRRAAPSAPHGRSAEQPATVSGTLLHLQRRAGNRAVAQWISSQRVYGARAATEQRLPVVLRQWGWGASAAPAEATGPAAGSAPAVAGPAPAGAGTQAGISPAAVAPPTEGAEVSRLAIVNKDTPDKEGNTGLNLRAAPSLTGAVLARLAHNDHLVVKREMRGDWLYVVVTEEKSPLKGATGYAAAMHIEDVPTRDDPDPGAILYRPERDGERAHEFVRRHYGGQNIKGGGQDQDFFANVLKYFNDKAGPYYSAHIPTKTVSRPRLWGAVSVSHEDPQLQKGQKIWVPSLDYALALKGAVGTGRLGRDLWEKAKGFAEKLAAIPVFIAGLVVGMLESLKDLVVGLFDLLWGLVKSAGGILIDMAKSLWGLATDPRMRQALLDAIDQKLTDMLYTGGLLKRAFNWGRIIGYMSMEVITTIVTAGAVAAFKAGKYGAKLAKLFEVLKASKKGEAIVKALDKARKLSKAPTAIKIAGKLKEAAVVGGKVAGKVAPVTRGFKRVVGGIAKVLGLPGEAVLGSARVLTRAMRRLAAKYGWTESRFAWILGIVEERGATVWLRKSSKWAPLRLAEGAAPKPLAIKANTLDELDLVLSGGQFTERQLGLVAHFEPLSKGQWARPRGMSEKKWKSLQPALEKKYDSRLDSFTKNEADMKKLTTPTTTPDSVYFELMPGEKVKGGLVYQVEIDDVGKAIRKPLSGDIDVFEFRTKKGELVGPEYEMLDDLFLEATAAEHGAHMAWRRRGDYNEDAFFGILERHVKDPVVEVAPGGKVRELTADQVPGVAEVLASPEYQAWKARKAAAKAR